MANPTKIPFLDLGAPHQELQAELLAVGKKAFSAGGVIGGPMVVELEQDVDRTSFQAAGCGGRTCASVRTDGGYGCDSGTRDKIQPVRDRRCMPGTWGGVLF